MNTDLRDDLFLRLPLLPFKGWPGSDWNGGRHQIGRVAAISLEYLAALRRNPQQGVPFRLIAEAIGRQLGLPSRSIAPDEAEAHFGGIVMFAGANGPASSERTRQALGWEPRETGIVGDIERPAYSA